MSILLEIAVSLIVVVYCWFRWRGSRKKLRRALEAGQAIGSVYKAYERGDYEAGLKLADNLKRGTAMAPAYWYFRGKMLYQLGRLEEARGCIEKSLALAGC